MTPDMCTLQAEKTTLMDKADFLCVVRVSEGTCLRHWQPAPVQTLCLCKFASTGEKSYQLVKALRHFHHLFTISPPLQHHLAIV